MKILQIPLPCSIRVCKKNEDIANIIKSEDIALPLIICGHTPNVSITMCLGHLL